MIHVWRDLRYAITGIRRRPLLAGAAVLSLALGIGANTAIFSYANAVLFRLPMVAHPASLVEVWTHDSDPSAALNGNYPLSYPDYLEFRDQNQALDGLAIYTAGTQVTMSNGATRASLTGELVSSNYFSARGVPPRLGRAFLPEEGAAVGSGAVVVLSDATWRKYFGADPSIIGRQIAINQNPFTVIGVAAPGYNGMVSGIACDFWAPVTMADRAGQSGSLQGRGNRSFFGIGRLRPGVTLASATANLALVQENIAKAHADEPQGFSAFAAPIGPVPLVLRSSVSQASLLLMAVVGLVLLIACFNAANVLLVQALAREREWTLRAALGASRGRLIRQGLTEAILLAGIAGVLGYELSAWAAPWLQRLAPPGFPIELDLQPDARMLCFAVGVALATAMLFGLAPALQAARLSVTSGLKEGSGGAGLSRGGIRSALIVAQVALCVVVLTCASLCLRSLRHASAIDPGFDTRHVIEAPLDPHGLGYSGAPARAFVDSVVAAMWHAPGVTAVAMASNRPLSLSISATSVLAEGMQPPSRTQPGIQVDNEGVGPGFFAAAGTPLLEGRDFNAHDLPPAGNPPPDPQSQPATVIVNRTLANRFWPGKSAVGQTLLFAGARGYSRAQVIGVAAKGKYRTLGEDPRAFLYQPAAMFNGGVIVIHVAGGAGAFIGPIRQRLMQLDGNLVDSDVFTIQQAMAIPLFPARAAGVMLGGFAALALILAVVGLYGVIASSVAQRTREFGIRMALGAAAGQVRSLVLWQGTRLALYGIAIGLLLSYFATAQLHSLLYGVSARDPLSFLGTAVFLLVVAMAAAWVPAQRATRLDPIKALHYE